MAFTLDARRGEQSFTVTVDELRLDGVSFHDLAEHFHARRDFALLDSQAHEGGLGAWSIFAFEPFVRFTMKDGSCAASEAGGEDVPAGDPLAALQRLFDAHPLTAACADCGVPFRGGAIGYFAYELGRQIEVLPHAAARELQIPDCYLCFYNFSITLEHATGRMFLCHLQARDEQIGLSRADLERELRQAVPGAFARSRRPRVETRGHLRYESDLSAPRYRELVGRIKEYIRAGDVYQVNMTQRFRAACDETLAWDLFKHAREINPAPFAAYLRCDGHSIMSSSPERFLSVRDRRIETRPIKGTIARGHSEEQDRANRETLLASVKNRAELAMIVDLLRNDIGRVCKPGTVRVLAYPELESYASVHHLVATITGDLEDDATIVDVIRATFPGGSVTGAPKIRAMEIIDELEPVARGIYTGSIGYVGFDGAVDLNIAIRTIVLEDGRAYFNAGGGVVADSLEQDEYDESLLKARKLIESLEAVCPPLAGGDARN